VKITATIRTMKPVEALRTATVLALEGLCFTCAEGFADDRPDGDTVDATVEFRGPACGAVSVAIPSELLQRIAADIGFTTATAQADLVRELANIVCGNVVPRIYGRGSVYDLSPPYNERCTVPAVSSVVVLVDGGWVATTLHGVDP
jgi:hypothetical protein